MIQYAIMDSYAKRKDGMKEPLLGDKKEGDSFNDNNIDRCCNKVAREFPSLSFLYWIWLFIAVTIYSTIFPFRVLSR
jgi:hypothetical protein